MTDFRSFIRDVPDFPTKGILFRDVTPLLASPDAFAAAALLASLGYHNVSVKAFDGTYGYPAAAPYDRILVTAGTESVPEPLLAQLAVGGRLVVPIGPPGKQRLRVIRRRKTDYAQEEGEDVTFVPLLGRFAGSPA